MAKVYLGTMYKQSMTEDERWIKCPVPLNIVRRRPILVNNGRESACCLALRRSEFSSLLSDPSFDKVITANDVGILQFRDAALQLMDQGAIGLVTSHYSSHSVTNADNSVTRVFPLLRALQSSQNPPLESTNAVKRSEMLLMQLCKPLTGKHEHAQLSSSLQDAISQWFRPYRDELQDIHLTVLHNLPRAFWLTGDHLTEIEMPRADGVAASIRLGPTRTGAFADYDIETGVVEPVVGHDAQRAQVYNAATHAGRECYIVFLVLKRR
jgi:hypothetical protein